MNFLEATRKKDFFSFSLICRYIHHVHYVSMCTTGYSQIPQMSRAKFWMRNYLLRQLLMPSCTDDLRTSGDVCDMRLWIEQTAEAF